jgi:predicted nucleic acid-binding protein
MIVACDMSAITSLIQISRADLLAQIYGEVIIAEAVICQQPANHE